MRSYMKKCLATQKTLLSIAIIGAVTLSPLAIANTTSQNGFINGSSLNTKLISDTRVRSNNTHPNSDFHSRLNYSSYNAIVDFNSGYYNQFIGVDVAGYLAGDIYNNSLQNDNDEYLSNEISLSNNQDWGAGDGPHFKLYTAAVKFQYHDIFNGKVGLIQSTGNGTVGNVWSFVPGTYRGLEVNAYIGSGKLTYFGADKYTAPWLLSEDDYIGWANTKWNYLHSIGYANQFGNFSYNLGIGQAMDVHYSDSNRSVNPISYKFYTQYIVNSQIILAADFYGVKDKVKYNGLGYMSGLSLNINQGRWGWLSQLRYANSHNDIEIVPRTIYTYAMNNGSWSQFWDALSDWNQSGETSLYNRLSFNAGNGWNYYMGVGYGSGMDQTKVGYSSEAAVNGTIGYTLQHSTLKGSVVQLHTTWLTRDEVKSATVGKDETDVRLQVIIPYTVF